jgi:hypothetical protein
MNYREFELYVPGDDYNPDDPYERMKDLEHYEAKVENAQDYFAGLVEELYKCDEELDVDRVVDLLEEIGGQLCVKIPTKILNIKRDPIFVRH